MADVAKKGVSTAENSNGFINNVASDTNKAAPGGMGGEGEEDAAGTSSSTAPDLLSFRLPASDDGASLEELIQSELALRISTAAAEEEQMDEEEDMDAEAEKGREESERGTAEGAASSPPVDLLLDFTEPTSPLGGGGAIDMFGREAEFPEDVLTPEEGVSPEEAVAGVGGRAAWVEEEVTTGAAEGEGEYWVAGGASNRRVPFIGPAEVSLVDFSTTVTDDSAFDMLTPPTEDKMFGVSIPEIRVDTPSASPEEQEEEVSGLGGEYVEQEATADAAALEEARDEGGASVEEEVEGADRKGAMEEAEIDGPIEEAGGVIFSRVDEDDGWECVGEVSVKGIEEAGGESERIEEDFKAEGGEVTTAPVYLVGELEEPIERREEVRKVEGVREVRDEFVVEEVSDTERVSVEEEAGVAVVEEAEGREAVEERVMIGELNAGRCEVLVSVEDVSAEEIPAEDERQLVSEEVEREEEEAREVQSAMGVEECVSEGVGEEGSDGLVEGSCAPVQEEAPPVGKVVIPSTFGGSGGPPSDETDRGPCVQHADVSSEFGVPACRPSLVDWNAVVKKEEQKGAIGTVGDSVQDVESPKKAGTRKVKKDSGGEGKKKAKKGKKSDAEKENLSVNLQSDMGSQMGVGFPKIENEAKDLEEEGLSGVSLQVLKETYCSQASKPFQADEKSKEVISASISISDLKRSFMSEEASSPSLEEGSEVEEDEEVQEAKGGRLAPELSEGEMEEEVGGLNTLGVGLTDTSRDAGEDYLDVHGDDGSDQNSVGSVKYYRSYSRLEQRTFGSLSVEKRAKSLVDLRRQSEGSHRELEGSYFGSPNREPIITGVSVKALRASYCNLVSLGESSTTLRRTPEPEQRSSFNKFDQLSKKTVLHVKSVDSSKVQKQFNEAAAATGTQGPLLCRSCGKQVFQMEQVKAERAVWHRNCFRCKECSKQLTLDIYSSHEGQLYCKPHFRELFKPKAVVEVEDVGPVRPRKPEMIIRENQPVELPPDVVRASDKPDLGLEELTSLDVKSRYKVFEKESTDESSANLEKSSSGINVKRSPSILSKLAKFQKKGMDIGVTDDSLNGVPFEQSDTSDSSAASSSEDEGNEEGGVVKASRHKKRERPVSFGKMDDMKNKWESVGANGVRKTREELREERKEEIQRLRSRLFMGKQGKMKEMYEQAVLESEKSTGATSNGVKRQPSERAKSLKERFEKGEGAADLIEDTGEEIRKEREEQAKRAKEEELSVFEAGISKKSRSLFLELDKAQKQQNQPSLLPTPKSPQPKDEVRKVREVITRQISDDVVRSSDPVQDVQVETADICNKFKFFETYQEAPRVKKAFRITPPREGQVKVGSPEREVYRDPNVVRCEDSVGEDDAEVVVKSHTTTKMLSLFRQMEENANKEEVPEGPKPLKRFTPPPDYTKESDSEEEDESEEDEDDEEEEEDEEQQDDHDPNIIRASDKIEDEFLKQAMSQNAARAKSLRAKFERWEATMEKKGEKANGTLGPEDESPSVDTTRNLRARFESMQSETKSAAAAAPERQRPRVNRFVEIQASCAELCSSCGVRVYPLEKVEAGGKILHKACFRCLQCNCILRMETYTMNNGNLYCMAHFKQLFIAKGNYDEGFGTGQHKTKWSSLKKQGKREDAADESGEHSGGKDDFFNENSFYTKDLM